MPVNASSKNFVGYITLNGVLHLFQDSADAGKFMIQNKHWSQCGWIDETVFHFKATKEDKIESQA